MTFFRFFLFVMGKYHLSTSLFSYFTVQIVTGANVREKEQVRMYKNLDESFGLS